MDKGHQITLGYTVYDDGVWLDCSCGWKHNLGFTASPTKAKYVADRHVRDAN